MLCLAMHAGLNCPGPLPLCAVSGVPELDGKQEAAGGRIVDLQVRCECVCYDA